MGQTAVDPGAEPPLERRVAAVRRERGLVGQQPAEQALGRARLSHAGGGADTGPPDRSPRELVDRAGIEVVDESVSVALERFRAHRRYRRRDPVELVRHDLVERRAPERMPAAVAWLEVGMDEALGDGTARAVDDCEHDARRVAQVELAGVEVEHVDQRKPAAGDSVTGSRDVGDGRDARLERWRRELTARVAQDRECGRVVLPEELEGARGQAVGDGSRLGQNQAA